jgi:hydroxymethylglutaryl-CoA lyase
MMTEIDILVSEVGPRDGLQSLDRIMPLEARLQWVSALARAGLREIEVGSFVSPKLLPQMAETSAVVAHALGLRDLTVAVLVPNLHGARAALDAGAHKISLPLSCSETHSLRNLRKDHDAVIEEIRLIRAEVDARFPGASAGRRPQFDVGLATAFGCSIEGRVDEAAVVRLAEAALSAGADEVGLSDTTGAADPRMMRDRVRAVRRAVGVGRLTGVHLHNTRGLGLANALAALDEGITTFDSPLAGLGGCPTAPGASGNIVTEDLVFMLEAMGLRTGVDLDRLGEARAVLARALPGEPLHGFVAEAGAPLGWRDRLAGAPRAA